jgi:4-hydroxybenzoate polyprenyltransferase
MQREQDQITLAAAADMVWQVVRTMRPHQWVKNLFLFAPLIFAQKLFVPGTLQVNTGPVAVSVAAFVVFSIMTGSVYMLNDLLDREKDRLHPAKKHRPIASGRLPVGFAKTTGAILTAAAIAAAFAIGWGFALVMLGYWAVNVAYSFKLKHVVFVDVGCIATGFILRILAGAVAIDVPVTLWLYACTFLLALFLGLGKRKHELVFADGSASTRKVLQHYDVDHVNLALIVTGVATTISYLAYTLSEHTRAQFGTHALVFTVPFIAFGLWRFVWLLNRPGEAQSPTDRMLRDAPFLVNLVLWGSAVLIVVYWS